MTNWQCMSHLAEMVQPVGVRQKFNFCVMAGSSEFVVHSCVSQLYIAETD